MNSCARDSTMRSRSASNAANPNIYAILQLIAFIWSCWGFEQADCDSSLKQDNCNHCLMCVRTLRKPRAAGCWTRKSPSSSTTRTKTPRSSAIATTTFVSSSSILKHTVIDRGTAARADVNVLVCNASAKFSQLEWELCDILNLTLVILLTALSCVTRSLPTLKPNRSFCPSCSICWLLEMTSLPGNGWVPCDLWSKYYCARRYGISFRLCWHCFVFSKGFYDISDHSILSW